MLVVCKNLNIKDIYLRGNAVLQDTFIELWTLGQGLEAMAAKTE